MVAVPKGAKVPDDHKSPAQNEAEGIPMADVTWRGHVWTVMSDPDDYPIATVQAMENNRVLAGLESVLGPEQWKEFVKTKPTKRDAADLLNVMGEQLGLGN